MTIEKGKDWGSRALFPEDAPIVSTDRELAELFAPISASDGTLTLTGPSHVGLAVSASIGTRPHDSATNLAKTVSAGATDAKLRQGERTHLPVDLAIVTIDGQGNVLASNLVIRHTLWTGSTDAVMNTSFLGEWNVAPRGHPNDGRVDVIRSELSIGDRWKARQRVTSGTHIPHPDITMRRLKAGHFTPDRGATIWLDGRRIGTAEEVDFVVVADATTIVI